MACNLTRRDLLKLSVRACAAGVMLRSPSALPARATLPTSPVAVGSCKTYGKPVAAALDQLFGNLGGLARLVKGKTVAMKVNLTGGPQDFRGRIAGQTFHPHPDVVLAACQAFARAGARRIRLLEGWDPALPASDFLGKCKWDLRALAALDAKVEFENTNNRGSFKSYAAVKPRHAAHIYPGFMLNRSYEETDVLVSLSKLKNHYTAGLTLSLKNFFGVAPSSFYGDDAGSERASQPRVKTFHKGTAQPAKGAPAEVDARSSRDDGYRVPRITIDLVNSIHPIELCIVDGIESVRGGEGPWVEDLQTVEPGLLVAGFNPVCTDAVCGALMGYNPRGDRGSAPFHHGDNMLKLAEAAGIGTSDLAQIDVRGLPVKVAAFPFE